MIKCNLLCRENAHFHRCYCPATALRKVQLITHLQKCKKKSWVFLARKLNLHSCIAQQPLLHFLLFLHRLLMSLHRCLHCHAPCTSSSPVTSVFQAPPTTQSWTSTLCQHLLPGTTCPLSEAPFSLSASTQVFQSLTIYSFHVPPEQPTVNHPRAKNRIRCDYCDMELNKKN